MIQHKLLLKQSSKCLLIFIFPVLVDLLQGVGKDAVDVLRMIKRRLQAEMKTVGRNDLRMLSRLLQEDDLEVRTVHTVRAVRNIHSFLFNTIECFNLPTLLYKFIRQDSAITINVDTHIMIIASIQIKTQDFLILLLQHLLLLLLLDLPDKGVHHQK